MLTAADLPHRLSVQVRTQVSDGHDGYAADTWTTTRGRIAGSVAELVGRDLERARQTDPRVSLAVRLRYYPTYRAGLASGRARLVYHPTASTVDDRILEIVAPPVDVEEAHIELRVLCREEAP